VRLLRHYLKQQRILTIFQTFSRGQCAVSTASRHTKRRSSTRSWTRRTAAKRTASRTPSPLLPLRPQQNTQQGIAFSLAKQVNSTLSDFAATYYLRHFSHKLEDDTVKYFVPIPTPSPTFPSHPLPIPTTIVPIPTLLSPSASESPSVCILL